MASNLFRLYRTADHVLQVRTAAAPSGGVYAVEGDVLTGTTADANLLRLSSSGSVVWGKNVNVTGGTAVHPWIASNGSYVAVSYENDAGDEGVVLYDSSGTVVWSTALPLGHIASSGATQRQTPPLAVAADNSVFILGNDGSYEAILAKLNASTGAVSWSVNLRQSGVGATSDFKGLLAVLSGGDLVVTILGTLNYVLRLDGTNGSVVWSNGVVWPSGSSETNIGVDGSDNIYLVGRPHTSGTKVLPVVKLDSSGATLWNRQVSHGAHSALAYQFEWNGRLTCDSTGVYIPCKHLASDSPYGHVFVPAAGTVATGTALVASFSNLASPSNEIGASGGTDVASMFAYPDEASGGATYNEAIVVIAGSSAAEDNSWGGRTRTTYDFDVQTGTAVISAQTYTRATNPSFSASSFAYTESATTLLVDSYAPTYPADSLGPTALFGTPRIFGVVSQEAYTVTTGFGTPILSDDVFATSAGPFTAFGTAAYSDDRSVVATALAAGTAFGLAWAERDPLPGSPTTIGADPSTAFGTPAVNGAAAVTAEGASSTAFGTPVSGWVCPVTGFAVGAFGTPVLSNPVRATGAAPSTAFGLGMTAGFGSTTGAAPSTAFGLPVATFGAVGNVTGASDTAFGTPSTLNNRQRTRSGVFRTQWGRAQAERTAP